MSLSSARPRFRATSVAYGHRATSVAQRHLADVRALVLALTAIAACDRDPSPQDTTGAGDPPADTTGAVQADDVGPSDVCEGAPLVSHGLYSGTLRGAGPDVSTAGVCGQGGPDAFLRVEVSPRADLRVEARGRGFEPRVSLASDDCRGGRELACSAAPGPLELRNLDPGTVVRVAIGVDPAVFETLNQAPAPEDGPDPLSFMVDVGLTRVLAAGEVCEPASRGRCADGSLCLPGTAGESHVCTPLPGDTCATALPTPVALDAAGEGALAIDPAVPQTDAHHHGCAGDGTRERVLRLALPAAPPQRALEITAGRPDVGLALRTPSCLASAELACAAPVAGGARVVVPGLAGLRSAGVEPYLFIELPDGSEQDPPFELQLRLVPESETWGG